MSTEELLQMIGKMNHIDVEERRELVVQIISSLEESFRTSSSEGLLIIKAQLLPEPKRSQELFSILKVQVAAGRYHQALSVAKILAE